MSLAGRAWRAPLDVWVCALLVGGGGLVFLIVGLVRWATEGGAGVLSVPVVAAALQLAAAAAVLAGVRPLRPPVLLVVALAALLQALIAVGNGYGWTRVVSAVLAVAQLYALVLLNLHPVRDHFGVSG